MNVSVKPVFEAILFDLDGTLVDTAPDLVAAANRLLLAHGKKALPYEELRPRASAGARGLIAGGFGITPEQAEDIPLRDEFFQYYESHICVDSVLFNGMEELLHHFEKASIPWGIVTNKMERFTNPLMQLMGLNHRACVIVSGDTTAHAKPHPEPLLHAARLAGIDPSKTLYVGDDHRDIIAGREAGMKTVTALYGYLGSIEPAHAWGADYEIQEPLDLLKIVFPK